MLAAKCRPGHIEAANIVTKSIASLSRTQNTSDRIERGAHGGA
jgi:hypothetical protein